jgi:hypothetical protein
MIISSAHAHRQRAASKRAADDTTRSRHLEGIQRATRGGTFGTGRAGDLDLGMRLFADTVRRPGTFDRRSPAARQMMRGNVLAHVADAITTRPVPSERPQEFASAVLAFLDRHSR